MSVNEHLAVYDISIQGPLQSTWAEWLGNRLLSQSVCDERAGLTVIRVAVPDQVALRGLLNKLWDLNLTVVSIGPTHKEQIGGQDDEEMDR